MTRIGILFTALIFMSFSANAQTLSVKQFFFPNQGKNRSDYHNVDDKGQRMKLTRSRYYMDRDGPVILDLMKYDGNSTSSMVEVLRITDDEVSSIKTINTSNDKEIRHDKPIVLLKLPKGPDDTVSWTNIESDGTEQKNVANFFVYAYRKKQTDGGVANTISRVLGIQVKTTINNESVNMNTTMISRYVNGIGFVSSMIYNKTLDKFKDFEVWDGTEYDSKVK